MALDTVAKLSNPFYLSQGQGGNGYNGGPYQWYTGSVGGVSTTFTTTATVCGPANSMFTNYATIDALPGDTYLTEFTSHGAGQALYSYWLADLLVAAGGLVGNVATLQSFVVAPDVSVGTNNMAVRRGAADYSDVRWFLTIQTDLGSTSQPVTMTYTNAAGTPNQTWSPGNLGGGELEGRFTRRVLPFNPPDGVRSIQSGQLAASTTGAGNWGVMAIRPLRHLVHNRTLDHIIVRWPSCLTKMPAQACPMMLGDYSGDGISSNNQYYYAKWVKA